MNKTAYNLPWQVDNLLLYKYSYKKYLSTRTFKTNVLVQVQILYNVFKYKYLETCTQYLHSSDSSYYFMLLNAQIEVI